MFKPAPFKPTTVFTNLAMLAIIVMLFIAANKQTHVIANLRQEVQDRDTALAITGGVIQYQSKFIAMCRAKNTACVDALMQAEEQLAGCPTTHGATGQPSKSE